MNKKVNEVRYLNIQGRNIPNEKPLKDTEKIRVFHGFYSRESAADTIKNGLSGKEKARRIYSYESGNNPYGLFVTTDFKVASNFASSGIIIEFTTKISDLEAPVWVDGRSYFVQGEYTKSFKDLDDREKQRLINRQKSGESPYDSISKSDRPELADTLFDNPERQALYIGDLNSNMIKRVWYNEVRDKKRLTNGPWNKYSVNNFLRIKGENVKKNTKRIQFNPNDDFSIKKFRSFLDSDDDLKMYLDHIISYDIDNDYKLKQYGFWPKQAKQLRDLNNKGFFDKYLKESKSLNENESNLYTYEKINENKYKFITDNNKEYIVNLIKQGDILIFNYNIDGDFNRIVNDGNMYKVLTTVFTIIKEFTNKNKWVKYIGYVPVRKGNEDIKNNIRHKLYIKFLHKFYNFTDDDIEIEEAATDNDYYVFVNIKNNKLIEIIIQEYKKIGSGQHGKAFIKNNKVYKTTVSVSEYNLAKKILESNIKFKSLPKIYKVKELKDDKFLIVKDYYDNIPDELSEDIDEDLNEIEDYMYEKILDIQKSNNNLTMLFEPKFLYFLENLKRELIELGYKPYNIDIEGLSLNTGLDKNGNYILFDF